MSGAWTRGHQGRTAVQAARLLRAEQATDAWQERYGHRSGVKGTIAQASRRGDLHHASALTHTFAGLWADRAAWWVLVLAIWSSSVLSASR